MSFLWQKRLGEGASDLLKHYYADILRRPEMLQALHAYDQAQLIMLAESSRPPPAALRQLVRALAQMWNARDAIRNYDYAIEAYMALALMHTTRLGGWRWISSSGTAASLASSGCRAVTQSSEKPRRSRRGGRGGDRAAGRFSLPWCDRHTMFSPWNG